MNFVTFFSQISKKYCQKLLLVAVFCVGSFSAHGTPILYDITFGASDPVPSGGTGSFLWDDSQKLISDFVWDFGAGNTGGYDTSAFDWGEVVFGPGSTASTYLFEILTGQDVDPTTSCPSCGFGREAFGAIAERMSFRNIGGALPRQYQIFRADLDPLDQGNIGSYSVSVSANQPSADVPEPAMGWLFAIATAYIYGLRRKTPVSKKC